MKIVLIFVPNYFPGYMSGGIARTILNTTEWLGKDFDFLIATRDRDLGSAVPYTDVQKGMWQRLGQSRVRYLEPDELSSDSLAELVNSTPHDILHLNSFFDPVFTIKLLLLRRLKKISSPRVVLSARGEFVPGPLQIKYAKKKLYIELSRFAGFYNDITWHASSQHESEGIAAALRMPMGAVRCAIDLPIKDAGFVPHPDARDGRLKVIFLSRLTREKNLDGALKILLNIRSSISFHIIGPQEDVKYWNECNALLAKLPNNIEARYLGPISPEEVFDTLARYDVFLFPSHGENYAHVIAESISVGTRVLISQNTPWRNLEKDSVGWDVALSDTQKFVDIIEALSAQLPSERDAVRAEVRSAAAVRLFDPVALEDNRSLYSKF